MAAHNEFGRIGEMEAIHYLITKDYHILAHDWRYGHMDLDVVVEKLGHLIVVEVKTRSDERFSPAEEAVDRNKIRHILASANAFVNLYKLDMPLRFDIITVVGRQAPFTIRHIKDAFDGSYWLREQVNMPMMPFYQSGIQREAMSQPLPFERLHANSVACTNDVTKCWLEERSDGMVLVTTDFQTLGRGQGGNHWESEANKNLLFSLGLRPTFLPAHRQFRLLQAASLAQLDTVVGVLPPKEANALALKWPNDLYYKDCKLSGTLIENRLMGQMIETSIIGIGLNVNQSEFHSDAPNPISLYQILGHEVVRETLLERFVEHFTTQYLKLQHGSEAELAARYISVLYRREGWHVYEDEKGPFRAQLAGVEADGRLLLRDESGLVRDYPFKKVKYLL